MKLLIKTQMQITKCITILRLFFSGLCFNFIKTGLQVYLQTDDEPNQYQHNLQQYPTFL